MQEECFVPFAYRLPLNDGTPLLRQTFQRLMERLGGSWEPGHDACPVSATGGHLARLSNIAIVVHIDSDGSIG
jgi:hypothetical protein